jgi:hypothetical protein
VEANFGDGMFSRLLETHLRQAGFKGRVEDHKVTGDEGEPASSATSSLSSRTTGWSSTAP